MLPPPASPSTLRPDGDPADLSVDPMSPRDASVPRARMSRRARRALWIAGIGMAMLISATIAASIVKVPYFAFSPGSLWDTASIVQVDGTEVYPADGTISFATVSRQGRLTVLRFALAWIDPDTVVIPEEQVIGERDPAEDRQINLQLMDVSTQVATFVALNRLGYDVGLTGSGAQIVQVEAGLPADGVLEPGDTIVAVDGNPITLSTDLVGAISEQEPGTTVTLEVVPLGSTDSEERQVTLGQREDDPTKAFLGVVPQTRDAGFELPVDVSFRTGNVAGPSAGLAFTLALLDMLTPGELTGGLRVAATGTMDVNGNVGPIGGVEHKAVAARRAGYDVFFIPTALPDAERAEAVERAGAGVRVIEVATLDQVLEELVELGGDPLPST